MIFIANWKMNGEKSHISGINKTIKFLKQSKNKKNQIIYCPPFTLISSVKNKVKNTKIKVGAQNLSQLNDYGAFTGSVNSKLIKSAGGEYVIVGHSEIRNQENDILINKKIHSALKEKLKVIKHYLEETYKDSRKYLDSFYEDCQNGEIDDLDWLASDSEMDDFVSTSELEYIRIYDYALLEISRRLLKMLDE